MVYLTKYELIITGVKITFGFVKLCKAGTFSRSQPVNNMPTVELLACEHLKMRKYFEAKSCPSTSKLTITGMLEVRSVILLQHVRNLVWA